MPAAGFLGAQNEGRGRWRCDEASPELVMGVGGRWYRETNAVRESAVNRYIQQS